MKDIDNGVNSKRGYLKKDFQFFHLKDKKSLKFEFHYHDFNKIIIFISGKVTYLIEGKAYRLKPWDILLVSKNEIHKPLIDSNGTYERVVIWLNTDFLEKHNRGECNLLSCFEKASSEKFNLMRLNAELLVSVKHTLNEFESECNSKKFGSEILRNSLLLQLIVYFNRLFLGSSINEKIGDVEYDKNIGTVLDYINENLSEDLSIQNISERFYISKYYLMHKFKIQTGYTIHNYIIQKRLIKAKELIKKGISITDVCIRCGFNDYSNFIRMFKKEFNVSPKGYYKNNTMDELIVHKKENK